MILLTGSTGLLGSHVLYALLQKHERVVAMKRASSSIEGVREIFSYYTDDPEPLMQRIEWRHGDMLDKPSLLDALDGITIVINCAAIVSFDPKDRAQLIHNNVQGTRNLAEAIWKRRERSAERREERGENVPLLIHISSTSALGDGPGNDPTFLINENTPRDPNRVHSGYSESKYQSETLITNPSSLLSTLNSLRPNVVLNPGIILGPGQWDKGSSQLFVKAWEGMKFYTNGGTGYVDVRDLADIITLIVEKWNSDNVEKDSTLSRYHSSTMINQRYCVVGSNLFYRDFFNLASAAFNKPRPSIFAGKFLSGLAWRLDTLRARLTRTYPLITKETAESAQRISFYDASKIKTALGFEFRDIEETVEWVTKMFRKRREGSVENRE